MSVPSKLFMKRECAAIPGFSDSLVLDTRMCYETYAKLNARLWCVLILLWRIRKLPLTLEVYLKVQTRGVLQPRILAARDFSASFWVL